MTVCIAAICGVGPEFNQKIVLCADRLVSSWTIYEGGEPKINKITDNCYTMQSSNDSTVSDFILERTRESVKTMEEMPRIENILDILKEKITNYKKDEIERDVLLKYNVMSEKFSLSDSVIKDGISEIKDYNYSPQFEFILLGLEPPSEAHIYVIDQDGSVKLYDSMGFATIGSGSWHVHSELTKQPYSRSTIFTETVPRVYIAKKMSERAQGVGRYTDLRLLYYGQSQNEERSAYLYDFKELLPTFDDIIEERQSFEQKQLDDLTKQMKDFFDTEK